jgi:hypothetical protein
MTAENQPRAKLPGMSLAASTTFAPSPADRCAVRLQMPLLAPVMTTTLSAMLGVAIFRTPRMRMIGTEDSREMRTWRLHDDV